MMFRHSSSCRAFAFAAGALVALPLGMAGVGTADATPKAAAAKVGSVIDLAPGVTVTTQWNNATPLVDGRGVAAPGLRNSSQGGVSNVQVAGSGIALVAEKAGRIVMFGKGATSGTVLTDTAGRDLTSEVLSATDTGLGGVALDPSYPARPYVYALYTSNSRLAAQGGGRWKNSECPEDARCIVDGRLERLTIAHRGVNGRTVPYVAGRTMLIGGGWCQGARTHSLGDLAFGPDRKLYASAGDGTPPYGGSATQQRLCRYAVSTKYPSQMAPLDSLDPAITRPSLNGKVIRVNPDSGLGAPGNPMYSSTDTNRQRIVAIGFRNPYRMALRPFSRTLGISMAGQTKRDGVLEIAQPLGGKVTNDGWPCWEASIRFSDGPLCKGLSQAEGTVAKPSVEWVHGQPVVPGEKCPSANPSVAMGVTYGSATAGPAQFRTSLLVNDFGRGCMWIRPNGKPLQWLASFDRQSIRAMSTDVDGSILIADYRTGAILRMNLG